MRGHTCPLWGVCLLAVWFGIHQDPRRGQRPASSQTDDPADRPTSRGQPAGGREGHMLDTEEEIRGLKLNKVPISHMEIYRLYAFGFNIYYYLFKALSAKMVRNVKINTL